MGSDEKNLVWRGIYLGSLSATSDIPKLVSEGVSYILSIDAQPLLRQEDDGITYKFVQCLDMPDADLLSHFDECFKFIDEALSVGGRNILVHCLAGMSRSATVVIAYLMYKDKISLEEAWGTVKQHRPNIRPNPGFREQLDLFERMGGVIDEDNELYRKYKLSVMAQKMYTGGLDQVLESDLRSNVEAGDKTEGYYKCRKCRRALFRSSSVMSHEVGQGEEAFDWRSRAPASRRPAADIIQNQSEGAEMCDKSLFIEPVQWMAADICQLDGKLMCPKCQCKLGSFIWYGEKCPCGTWVAPAFHIQSSKVDYTRARPAVSTNQKTTGQDTCDVTAKSDSSSVESKFSKLNLGT